MSNLIVDTKKLLEIGSLFRAKIQRVAKMVNVSKDNDLRKLGYSTSFVPIRRDLVKMWADDILRLKKIICSLPERVGMDHQELIDTFQMNLGEYRLSLEDMASVSVFFRPDCILTEQGPKVIEFNIDSGCLSLPSGMVLKEFYQCVSGLSKYIHTSYGALMQDSFFAEQAFADYLKNKKNARYFLWDIANRTRDVVNDRNLIMEYLKGQGIELKLLEGTKVLLERYKPNDYLFRFFAYPHFAVNKNWEIYQGLPKSMIKSFDVSASSFLYDSKIFLALLWDKNIQKFLASDEIDLIAKYIPKSQAVDRLDGKELADIILNKNKWILKKGTSFQGKDVFIGRETAAEDWKQNMVEAKANKGYIIQEIVSSLKIQIELTDGTHFRQSEGANLMNFYYVGNKFSGIVFRFKVSSGCLKVGAIDGRETFPVLPLIF